MPDKHPGGSLSVAKDSAYTAILSDTYSTEAPGLIRYFKQRMRDDEDANDLMQEAFARLAAHMRTKILVHPASYLLKQRIPNSIV